MATERTLQVRVREDQAKLVELAVADEQRLAGRSRRVRRMAFYGELIADGARARLQAGEAVAS